MPRGIVRGGSIRHLGKGGVEPTDGNLPIKHVRQTANDVTLTYPRSSQDDTGTPEARVVDGDGRCGKVRAMSTRRSFGSHQTFGVPGHGLDTLP